MGNRRSSIVLISRKSILMGDRLPYRLGLSLQIEASVLWRSVLR